MKRTSNMYCRKSEIHGGGGINKVRVWAQEMGWTNQEYVLSLGRISVIGRGYDMGNKITCCYQCRERFLLCHATCERYLEERRQMDEIKTQRTLLNDEMERYRRQRINKIKR